MWSPWLKSGHERLEVRTMHCRRREKTTSDDRTFLSSIPATPTESATLKADIDYMISIGT